MNNGQPPYGDPNAWGQQGNQANPPQYPVQPNPYAPQGGYPQIGQQPPQQTWQPQQGYSQPYAPVETYQQQPHPQQQVYQQQSWQPYQQPYQPQGYEQSPQANPYGYQQPQANPYGYQQPQQPQQAYPQFNQMGQQVQQGYGTGYSGYYSQPQDKKFEIPFDVAGKVVLYGVLPLLFVLAMIFAAPALKWIFLAGAVGGIILMWMKDIVSPNMRLTLSLVYGVMAVVALVGALNGQPSQAQNSNPTGQNNAANQQNQTVQQNVTTPTVQPTATPAPEDAADSAVEQLMSFFYFWSVGNDDAMLALTPPSWRAQQENPAGALFQKLSIRVPQDDYEVTSITGTEADALRTATVKVTIDKKDGRSKMDRYAFKVLMKKEDGVWYVDPASLSSNEKETATETVSNVNTTPTQPPLYTGTPATVLYYNANGGSMYHLDPDCSSVGKKYKPMASFMFVDLDQSPYNALRPCNVCGAPIPDD